MTTVFWVLLPICIALGSALLAVYPGFPIWLL